jgi:4-amino-4-deoxy-L-arabinose transferase-like glycosyltransferase
MHRTYAQLLWPLDYAQAAPPLFLWIERWIYLHWGFGEDQLRLVSLLCGAASVGLFAWVVWRRFPAPIAVAAAAIFAFCDKLIWHSDEVKQYSSDVFSALILIALAIGLRRPVSSLRRLWLIALVSAVLLWFSFPVVFVYGPISLMLLVTIVRRVAWGQISLASAIFSCLAANVLVMASFILLYRITVSGHAPYLDHYWREHFADWSRWWTIPWWLISEVFSLCDHPYRSFGWLVLPMAATGAVALYRSDRRDLLWVSIGPIGFNMIGAILGKYPFTGERITVFLVPGLFLLVAAALDAAASRRALRYLWIGLCLPFIVIGVGSAVPSLLHPRARSGIRPVVEYIQKHRQPGEAICMVGEGELPNAHFISGSSLELLCYWPDAPGPLYGAPGTPPLRNIHQIKERRFWIVFAALPKHGSRNMEPLLADARSIASQLDRNETPGGGAFLFEKR